MSEKRLFPIQKTRTNHCPHEVIASSACSASELLIVTPPQYGSGLLRSACLSVCPCVCLFDREHISIEPMDQSSRNFVQMPCGRGSVLLWWRCDALCTSGFMDDVTFGRSGLYGDAWKAEPQPTTTSGVAVPARSLMSMNALFAVVAGVCSEKCLMT